MGHGHDHGHNIKIPDYRIYKVEDAPKLLKIQEALAAKGLKDPWLRNEVWRFNPKIFGNTSDLHQWKFLLFRGFKYGLIAAVITVGIEKGLEHIYSDGHGHGDAHGGHH